MIISPRLRDVLRHGSTAVLVLGTGAAGLGQTEAADLIVSLPTEFQTLNYGTTGTFLTGIRGDNIVGNYTIPASGQTGGLYYSMTTQQWSPMPVATANGSNFPGAIGSSPYGPNFGTPGGILRTVGSFKTTASNPYDLSYLYDAANAPGQELTTLVYPGSDTLFTIAHSTFGHQVVGNYDTRLATGNAFIYDINTGTYTTNNVPGAVSTTAYGIYGDKIAGGYGQVNVDGVLHLAHAYVYDQVTGTYVTYDHPRAVATHFEGVTSAGRSGEYNFVANWVTADGTVHPAVMHLDALGIATWYEINIPGSVVSSNSAYGDNVVGIYVNSAGVNGYLATIPGIYNPIRNAGTLTSSADNAAALSGRKGDDIINTGTVQVSGNAGVGMRGETYGVLTNRGTVTATGIAGAAAEMHGVYGTLLNYGTLQAPAVADALRTGADAFGTVIVNKGIIDGRIAATAGPQKRFENSGWIGVTGSGFPITHLYSGTYVQTSAGTYAVRVTDQGNDTFGITGMARLDGTLEAAFQTSTYAPSYTVLGATQGVSGAFHTLAVSGLPDLFAATVSYAPTTVTLTVASDIAGQPGTTSNQQAVGSAIDNVINTTTTSASGATVLSSLPNGLTALYGVSAADLPAALDALSGEAYASEQSVRIGDTQYTRQSVLGRVRQGFYAAQGDATRALAFGGPALAYAGSSDPAVAPFTPPEFAGAAWAQVFGGWSTYDGGSGTASVDATYGGILTGADVTVANWMVGLAAGYSQSSADVNALASSSDVDSAIVALYAGTGMGPLSLRLGASYAFDQIDTSRSIAFPGHSALASSDYDGNTAQVFAEAGYAFAVQTAAIEPFAGLAYVHQHTGSFTETGAVSGLSGGSSALDVGYTTLGLRIATETPVSGMVLKPHASLAWQYAFGDTTPEQTVAFLAAPGTGFTVAGVPIADNTALIEVGADLAINARTSLGASYVGQFADGTTVNAVQATFTLRF